MQSDNLTAALRSQGVSAATPLTRVYDVSGTLGGPIVRDRLWYFVNAHTGGSTKESATVYYNLNAGDPAKWLYAPDFSRREYSDRTFENASGRVTWQVTPRNRVSVFWDEQSLCRTCTGATPGLSEPAQSSPEAVGVLGRPLQCRRPGGGRPLTNRLLDRRGLRRDVIRRRQLRTVTESDTRSDSRRRAVRERLRGERQHSRAGRTDRRTSASPTRARICGRVDLLRHRHAQPEGRATSTR